MKIQRFTPLIENLLLQQNEAPQVFKALLSESEIAWLIQEQEKCLKVEKASGVINYKYPRGGDVEQFIETKMRPFLGPLYRHGGSYFVTPTAFHAHTDTGKIEEMQECRFPFKNILIPLISSTDENPLYTVFFNQRNVGQASHFWRSPRFDDQTPFYNFKVTDYSDLLNLAPGPFDSEAHQRHLNHLPRECLDGLSVMTTLTWHVGDVICFDCNLLHASNNFEKTGVFKRGLSYFGSRSI